MNTDTINPFNMSTIEFEKWIKEEDKKRNNIHSLLSHLQFIPSLWRIDKNNFIIISKSTKKENSLQLTYFKNNVPMYDMVRYIEDISDIVEDIYYNNAMIETINYIY